MKKIIMMCIIALLALSLFFVLPSQEEQPDTTIPEEIDQQALINEASEYFEQMSTGDFLSFYKALPKGIREQTSPEQMKATWDEETQKTGASPTLESANVTLYRPEFSDQLRVEFLVHGSTGDFKVFINYSLRGALYNYVIWIHK